VIDPGNTVVDLGPLSPGQVAELERELGATMPHTGSDADALVLAALVAFLVGSALIVVATRRRDEVPGGPTRQALGIAAIELDALIRAGLPS
jgi:LPXTG-motif cell wall-anchored protein